MGVEKKSVKAAEKSAAKKTDAAAKTVKTAKTEETVKSIKTEKAAETVAVEKKVHAAKKSPEKLSGDLKRQFFREFICCTDFLVQHSYFI